MTRRTTSSSGIFNGMTYAEAVDLVDSSPGVSRQLRRRIIEDRQRDPLASFEDAKLLCALQRMRLDAMLAGMQRTGLRCSSFTQPNAIFGAVDGTL